MGKFKTTGGKKVFFLFLSSLQIGLFFVGSVGDLQASKLRSFASSSSSSPTPSPSSQPGASASFRVDPFLVVNSRVSPSLSPSSSLGSNASSSSFDEENSFCSVCQYHSPTGECLDARVYVANLELGVYDEERHELVSIEGSNAREWHERRDRTLLKICAEFGEIRGTTNFALAGVQFIYVDPENVVRSTPIVDVTDEKGHLIIFASGFKFPPKPHLPIHERIIEGNKYVISTVGDFSRSGNVQTTITDMIDDLNLRYFSYIKDKNILKLDESEFSNWLNSLNLDNDNFARVFFHSEQAFRLYILKNTGHIFKKLIEFTPDEPKIRIKQLVIHFSSINSICSECGTTYFLLATKSVIKDKFKSMLKKNGFQLYNDDLSILTEVSGLVNYRDSHQHREEQRCAHPDMVNAETFPPHVAQKFITDGRSAQNRDLLRMMLKVSSETKTASMDVETQK